MTFLVFAVVMFALYVLAKEKECMQTPDHGVFLVFWAAVFTAILDLGYRLVFA